MYITYCRNQRTLDVANTTAHRLNAKAGAFRPTYLIRVSDWEKVPGKDVKDGYCALSYVWAQSGEVVQKENNEYDCIDNGKHCIVEGYDLDGKDSVTLESLEEQGKSEEYIVKFTPSPQTVATIKHVTYEQLLQQLCKDFQIEYLWYDKLCIDQSNKKIKLQEIKQMHQIYGNACYTVAIVPEVHIHNPKAFDILDPVYKSTQTHVEALGDVYFKSLWWKRSWTLEETMLSKRILLIGTNTNLWQHSFHGSDIPTTYDNFSVWMLDFANQQQGGGRSVNQALSEAHFRTSSKEHDKIFALANIFHELFENMEISYKINIETTFRQFYQTIAKNDLSILCFGSNFEPDGSASQDNTMQNHHLPSWTGISGYHIVQRVSVVTNVLLQSPHSICDNMFLHVPTRYYKTLAITPYDYGCFSPLSGDKQQWDKHIAMFKKRRQAVGSIVKVEEDTASIDWAIKMLKVSGCYATHHHIPQDASVMQTRPLSLTEDCEECIVLPILLKSHFLRTQRDETLGSLARPNGYTHFYFLPVFKKFMDGTTEERYKAIGIYFLGGPRYGDLSSDDPDEILNTVFGDDDTVHHDVKEFVIM